MSNEQPSWGDVLAFCFGAAVVTAILCVLLIWRAGAWKP
jgi:hypothetical protein